MTGDHHGRTAKTATLLARAMDDIFGTHNHKDVLSAAIRQVPAGFRARVLVRVDGAGASHELVKHLLPVSSPRRKVLFTSGWMITAADEDAIRQVPAAAWKPSIGQDGAIEEDKAVAEVTHLMSRAGNWPGLAA